jgi:hypothetical protein
VVLRLDLPDLLDAGGVDLGGGAVQLRELREQLLGARAARPLAEHDAARADLGPRLEDRLGAAVARDAPVLDLHAHHAPSVEEQLRGGFVR